MGRRWRLRQLVSPIALGECRPQDRTHSLVIGIWHNTAEMMTQGISSFRFLQSGGLSRESWVLRNAPVLGDDAHPGCDLFTLGIREHYRLGNFQLRN